ERAKNKEYFGGFRCARARKRMTGNDITLKFTGARLGTVLLCAGLAGCAVGLDYRLPVVEVGGEVKEAKGWVQARPSDHVPRPDWWRDFDDEELNHLMSRMLEANLAIAQAEARYRQAQALVRAAGAGFFPTIGTSASATRSGGGS